MFKNMAITFKYSKNHKSYRETFNKPYKNADFSCNFSFEQGEDFKKLILSIIPYEEIEIQDFYLTMDYSYTCNEKIFCNGYQSWTDSREYFTDEKIRTLSRLARPLLRKYQFHKYGDYTFKKYSRKKGEFHGYTYSYIRQGGNLDFLGSLSERSGYTIIEEHVKDNRIIVRKECEKLIIDKEYLAFQLVWITGKENEVFDKYFQFMKIKPTHNIPMNGWTSWYNYYQNISEDIIIRNLNALKTYGKNIDIFQIDDGYATAVGDWLSVDKKKFPRGMKYIGEEIKAKGYKAGIWLAPFVCETTSEIFKNKKNWILKDEKGQYVLAGSNWSRFYVLDFYNPEVRAYLKEVFHVVLDIWGYGMVKLDFLYAVCLMPTKTKTRGEIMTEAMEFLRQCVGDKLILGCGVPLGPAFGLVDYCRIGCDVSLDWDDKFFMKYLHRERVSTFNAIRNSIERRHLNNRAFLNDPDVFLLREENISLTHVQKDTLSMVNYIFGTLIFTSDNIENYGEEQHHKFDKIMKSKAITIDRVETYRNNLVEVLYEEDNDKYLALINLSGDKSIYNNTFEGLEEQFIRNKGKEIIKTKELKIQPYETRVFLVK